MDGLSERVLRHAKDGDGLVIAFDLHRSVASAGLAVDPPAIVIDFLNLLIRAFKQGYILLHPVPAGSIGNGIPDGLVINGVEMLNVVFKLTRSQS